MFVCVCFTVRPTREMYFCIVTNRNKLRQLIEDDGSLFAKLLLTGKFVKQVLKEEIVECTPTQTQSE